MLGRILPGNSSRLGTFSATNVRRTTLNDSTRVTRPSLPSPEIFTLVRLALGLVVGLVFLSGCQPPASDQKIQEQAAQATEQAKKQSAEAVAQAKVAAANAERTVNDVAAGVKQGLDSKSAPAGRLDLNDASAGD